jgi:hypothetical protein
MQGESAGEGHEGNRRRLRRLVALDSGEKAGTRWHVAELHSEMKPKMSASCRTSFGDWQSLRRDGRPLHRSPFGRTHS